MCQQRSVYWLILSRSTSTKGNHGSAKGKLEAVFSLLLSLFARKRGKKRMEVEEEAESFFCFFVARRYSTFCTSGTTQENGRLESGHVLATLKY